MAIYEKKQKRVSQFITDNEITTADVFARLKDGVNRKTSIDHLLGIIADIYGLSARVYVDRSEMVADDIQIGEIGIVQGDRFAVYSIGVIAAGNGDVTLSSGYVATQIGKIQPNNFETYAELEGFDTAVIMDNERFSVVGTPTTLDIRREGTFVYSVDHGLSSNNNDIFVLSADWYAKALTANNIPLTIDGTTTNVESYLNASRRFFTLSDMLSMGEDAAILLADSRTSCSTTYNNTTSIAGGAIYSVWHIDDFRIALGSETWVPDGTGAPHYFGAHHYIGESPYVVVQENFRSGSMESCGVRGDNINDDGVPIQLAMSAFRHVTGCRSNVSPYRYKVLTPVAVGSGRVFEGIGSSEAGVEFETEGNSLFVMNASPNAGVSGFRAHSDKSDGDYWAVDAYNCPRGIRVTDVSTRGFGNANGGGAVRAVTQCWGTKITRLNAESGGYGIYAEDFSSSHIDTPIIRKNALQGLKIIAGVSTVVTGGVIEKTWEENGAIEGNGYSIWLEAMGYSALNSVYTEQSQDGLIKIKDCFSVNINNCFVDGFNNGLIDGLISVENSDNTVIEKCKLEGLYSGIGSLPKTLIYIDSSSENCRISNNTLEKDGNSGGYPLWIDDGVGTTIDQDSEVFLANHESVSLPVSTHEQSAITYDAPFDGVSQMFELLNSENSTGSGVSWHYRGLTSSRQTRMRIETSTSTQSPRWVWSIENDGEGEQDVLRIDSEYLRPGRDNVINFGSPSFRIKEIFSANGTINTSDQRLKTEIIPLGESERLCAIDIKKRIGSYRMLDSVREKGGAARIHFGVGAQEVIDIFKNHGLNPSSYSLICYDEWDDQFGEVVAKPATYDKDGNEISTATYERGIIKKAGNRYGIRYDQLAMFMLASL